jgi:uncharacterized SAM-binding protein YcdF (DUF218 family)
MDHAAPSAVDLPAGGLLHALLRAAVRLTAAPLTSLDPPAPADAVVVLGAPLAADGSLSPQAEERVTAGVAIFRRGLAPVLCLAGGHGPAALAGSDAEAEGMARWVRALGVPEAAIRVDRASTCTHTNALRAAEILLPEGRRRVWLVTQPFHTRRAKHYFRRAGFEPLGWRIEGGVQDRDPVRALNWIAREYAAWALALWRVVGPRPSARDTEARS